VTLNATLIGQAITFAILIWFIMRFVWPPIMAALDERARKIEEGLAAAERGKRDLELAAKRAADVLREAKQKAAEIITQGERRRDEIIEEAKSTAKAEGERLLSGARAEIGQEIYRAREALRQQVSELAVAGAERILRREIDPKAHADLLAAIQSQI
jgi:F-type H+-transporting ATPase subunit b